MSKIEIEIENTPDTVGTLLRTNVYRGLLIRVGGAIERLFKKKLLEFEEEEENNAPIGIDVNDNYDNTDLFCEKVDEEGYDLCSGCDENPFAHLVQPCVHIICTNCV